MCKKKESWEDFLSFFLYPNLPTFALGNQNKTERQWCREQQYLRVHHEQLCQEQETES